MHQHPILLLSTQLAEAQQAAEYRVGTLGTTIGAMDTRIIGTTQTRPVRIVYRQANHYRAQLRMIEKARQGVFDNAFAGQLQVLLGPIGAHPAANTGSRDQRPERGEYGRIHSAN